jgi:hypothetical protein
MKDLAYAEDASGPIFPRDLGLAEAVRAAVEELVRLNLVTLLETRVSVISPKANGEGSPPESG